MIFELMPCIDQAASEMTKAADIMSRLTENLLSDLCVGMFLLAFSFKIFELTPCSGQAASKMSEAPDVMG